MKKEVAERWVKALRSGKYEQGVGALKHKSRYCCLGVLCEISGLIEGSDLIKDTGTCILYAHSDNELKETIPDDILEWSEMKNGRGEFWDLNNETIIYLIGRTSLADANDHGDSFNQIADFIEKHWEIL